MIVVLGTLWRLVRYMVVDFAMAGAVGAGIAALRVRRVRRRRPGGGAHRWTPRPRHARGGGPC